jgi:hypothetical protein
MSWSDEAWADWSRGWGWSSQYAQVPVDEWSWPSTEADASGSAANVEIGIVATPDQTQSWRQQSHAPLSGGTTVRTSQASSESDTAGAAASQRKIAKHAMPDQPQSRRQKSDAPPSSSTIVVMSENSPEADTPSAAASSARMAKHAMSDQPQSRRQKSDAPPSPSTIVVMSENSPEADTPSEAASTFEVVAMEPARSGGKIGQMEPPGIYGVDFFRNFTNFTAHHQQHNAALKYWRWFMTKEKAQSQQLRPVETIHEIAHGVAMSYEIDESKECEWSWLEMVAQLTDEDMVKIVQGDDGRSRGLIGCSISQRNNSYDHKMHHKLRVEQQSQAPERLAIWDFELQREDNTGVRLHPSWKGSKVETFRIEGHNQEVQPPEAGLGCSDGAGTYKKYKILGNQQTIRFDPQKWQSRNVRKKD